MSGGGWIPSGRCYFFLYRLTQQTIEVGVSFTDSNLNNEMIHELTIFRTVLLRTTRTDHATVREGTLPFSVPSEFHVDWIDHCLRAAGCLSSFISTSVFSVSNCIHEVTKIRHSPGRIDCLSAFLGVSLLFESTTSLKRSQDSRVTTTRYRYTKSITSDKSTVLYSLDTWTCQNP